MRTFHSEIKALKLNSIPKEYDKSIFLQKLAASLRARVRLDLERHRKRFHDDKQCVFVLKM